MYYHHHLYTARSQLTPNNPIIPKDDLLNIYEDPGLSICNGLVLQCGGICVTKIQCVPYTSKKQTKPYMTKFEKAKILGIRAQMLANGSLPLVDVPTNIINVKDIARIELKERKMPLIIKRYLPDKSYECWRLDDMVIDI